MAFLGTTPLGWSVSTVAAECGVVRYITPGYALGVEWPIMLRASAAPVLLYLIRRIDEEVEPVDPSDIDKSKGDEWGWEPRANVNNPSRLSEHGGAAVDINATIHGNGRTGTWGNREAGVRRIIADIDKAAGKSLVRWGEDFPTTDGMHFELRNDQDAIDRVIEVLELNSFGYSLLDKEEYDMGGYICHYAGVLPQFSAGLNPQFLIAGETKKYIASGTVLKELLRLGYEDKGAISSQTLNMFTTRA